MGRVFGFQMYGKDVQLDEVMVGLKYKEDQNYFDIRFYDEQLCSLDDNSCYNAFYIMMELTIGEALSHIYIGNVDKADGMEAGMFPLTRLEACMTVALEEAKKRFLPVLTSVIVFIEWNSIPLRIYVMIWSSGPPVFPIFCRIISMERRRMPISWLHAGARRYFW